MVEEDRVVSESELNEPAEDDVESLKEALAQEKEKAERYLANWQRTEADFRNYKAREEQGKKDLVNWANSTLICDILPVLDAFDRAFEGVNPEDEEVSWITGFRQIQKMLLDVLNKYGLAEMKCVGEAFDPSFHEAVAQQKGAEGVVLDEVLKGYKLKDKLLRASQVVVGGGDESSTAETAEQVEEDLSGETG
ncbi:MAG: nucleotide exchange factor GrpE [Dehalococcoidia bacterium]|nr:nucleotide exchange factor GrpE [Dehalococcoidia bacterium]